MLKVLSSEQVYDVHLASLEVLERVGVAVREPEALRLFKSHGANVDFEARLVRLPSYLVEEAVDKTPKSLVLGGRTSKHDIHIRRGNIHTRPGSGYIHVLDLETGEFREGQQRDTEETARIVDASRNISFAASHILPFDVPTQVNDVYALKIMLMNTEKHVLSAPLSGENMKHLLKLALCVGGGEDEFRKRPLISVIVAPSSPLKLSDEAVKIVKTCSEQRVPLMLDSIPISGATGPITLAGATVLQNAENLALLVLVQLTNPNTPVTYGPRCATMDMRTGFPLFGSVEFALMSVACVQVAHYYGIPVDAYGPSTNAKTLDEQAGFEKAITGMLPALAGAEIVSGSGCMEAVNVTCREQLVIDDEFYGMMFRACKGVVVDLESLAVDVISRVGPGGHFLGDEHTLKYLAREHHLLDLFDTHDRRAWELSGAKDLRQRASERVKKILKEHQPPQLDPDMKKELEEIVDEATRSLSKKT